MELKPAMDTALALSRGFDAGNYAGAYLVDGVDHAWLVAEDSDHLDDARLGDEKAFRAAFLIGFFSSFEDHEVEPETVDEWRDALAEYGPAMRAMGIAVSDVEVPRQMYERLKELGTVPNGDEGGDGGGES